MDQTTTPTTTKLTLRDYAEALRPLAINVLVGGGCFALGAAWMYANVIKAVQTIEAEENAQIAE